MTYPAAPTHILGDPIEDVFEPETLARRWQCCGCGAILTLLPGEEDCCGAAVNRIN